MSNICLDLKYPTCNKDQPLSNNWIIPSSIWIISMPASVVLWIMANSVKFDSPSIIYVCFSSLVFAQSKRAENEGVDRCLDAIITKKQCNNSVPLASNCVIVFLVASSLSFTLSRSIHTSSLCRSVFSVILYSSVFQPVSQQRIEPTFCVIFSGAKTLFCALCSALSSRSLSILAFWSKSARGNYVKCTPFSLSFTHKRTPPFFLSACVRAGGNLRGWW